MLVNLREILLNPIAGSARARLWTLDSGLGTSLLQHWQVVVSLLEHVFTVSVLLGEISGNVGPSPVEGPSGASQSLLETRANSLLDQVSCLNTLGCTCPPGGNKFQEMFWMLSRRGIFPLLPAK